MWWSMLVLVCHCKCKMMEQELKIKNKNQPAGFMLSPPAIASGCLPMHMDARGGGSAKTSLLQ